MERILVTEIFLAAARVFTCPARDRTAVQGYDFVIAIAARETDNGKKEPPFHPPVHGGKRTQQAVLLQKSVFSFLISHF